MTLPTPLTVDEAREAIRTRTGFQVDHDTGCWLWEDSPANLGPYWAFYEAAFGEVPDGCRVYHLCSHGRRGCVRPGHLELALPGEPLPDPKPSVVERNGVAKRLADEREARRWTQAQFARFLGVSTDTLRNWERGVHAPSTDAYAELVRKLGWDGKVRKWKVILVAERVVPARSAGEAAREVWDELEVDGQPRKTVVASVQPA